MGQISVNKWYPRDFCRVLVCVVSGFIGLSCTQIARPQDSNSWIGDEAFRKRAEAALGVTFTQNGRPTSPNIYQNWGKLVGVGIASVTPGGWASRRGITPDYFILSINGAMIDSPGEFQKEASYFFCDRTAPNLQIGFSRDLGFRRFGDADMALGATEQGACAGSESKVTSSSNIIAGITYLNFPESSFGLTRESDNDRSLAMRMRNIIDAKIGQCLRGCVIQIVDGTRNVRSKYGAYNLGNNWTFFALTPEVDREFFQTYAFGSLQFLPNLFNGHLDLIELTYRFQPHLARLYYHFAVSYAQKCRANISSLSALVRTSTETTTRPWSSPSTRVTGKEYIPVETVFAARTADYYNWYVYGLSERTVRTGVDKFIATHGCTSNKVQTVRRNLLGFGRVHTRINARNGIR